MRSRRSPSAPTKRRYIPRSSSSPPPSPKMTDYDQSGIRYANCLYSYIDDDSCLRALDDPSQIAYQTFISLISIVTQLGMGISIGASLSLASSSSFMGRSDDTTMADVQHSSQKFVWSAAVFGMSLAVSSATQMFMSAPGIAAMLGRDTTTSSQFARRIVGVAAWMSLGLVVSSLALIGEGVKLVNSRAGEMLQWSLLGIALLGIILWSFLYCIKGMHS